MQFKEVLPRCLSKRYAMRGMALCLALGMVTPVSAQYVEDLSARSILIANLGESALLSMQLLAARAQNRSDIPASVLACVKSLDKTSFDPILSIAISENLSDEEIAAAENFYASDLGRKYAKHGLLQVYEAAGAEPPEDYPAFSEEEMKTLEAFSLTPAGDKLIVKKVLAKPPVRRAMASLTQELFARCHAWRVQR
ncbi:MAG: hypothetical protein JSS58_05470 [Proteobacteria bacterium]|nr:hypothetical protein [Pseudomonadota bacterium]